MFVHSVNFLGGPTNSRATGDCIHQYMHAQGSHRDLSAVKDYLTRYLVSCIDQGIQAHENAPFPLSCRASSQTVIPLDGRLDLKATLWEQQRLHRQQQQTPQQQLQWQPLPLAATGAKLPAAAADGGDDPPCLTTAATRQTL